MPAAVLKFRFQQMCKHTHCDRHTMSPSAVFGSLQGNTRYSSVNTDGKCACYMPDLFKPFFIYSITPSLINHLNIQSQPFHHIHPEKTELPISESQDLVSRGQGVGEANLPPACPRARVDEGCCFACTKQHFGVFQYAAEEWVEPGVPVVLCWPVHCLQH